ncbi:ARM repeat-containing protein [Fistulina hepatica ATCC 64428]|uniref:MMS19 nucleotide excision repair protein n=1 Tax=Fistulina hepatica ATCC 64428 TaxID=1128425 RepID=A0A0D6ZZ38_9AGAR|nr:ARM repeat-containing protein [Fistulina hepatica ATCC 64428]
MDRIVRVWIASGRTDDVQEAASLIETDHSTWLDVVKALGEFLTSEDGNLRTKGVEFLSSLIEKCVHSDKFTSQSTHTLTVFYISKLDDLDTIVPALQGLVPLISLSSFAETDVVPVVNALFTHVRMKALVQSVRWTVFRILDGFMARNREVLKKMEPAFLPRYVALVDGEKDPRNLLLAFAIARVLLVEFEVHPEDVESLFNITFCYFPITFRPPPNDPYGISADELRVGLRSCLSATPAFATPGIPVFLEKLAAGSPAVKRDTLVTLATCFPVYGSGFARSNARKLWNSIKLEIFQPTDPETQREALRTVQALVRTIYSTPGVALSTEVSSGNVDNSLDLPGLGHDICNECLELLNQPEKSQAQPAVRILCAMIEGTEPHIARYTLSRTLPHLIVLYRNPDEASVRAPVLRLLGDVVRAARNACARLNEPNSSIQPEENPHADPSSSAEETHAHDHVHDDTPMDIDVPLSTHLLEPYKDDLLGVLTSGLQVPPAREAAIEALEALIEPSSGNDTTGQPSPQGSARPAVESEPPLLTEEELGYIVHHLGSILQDAENDADSRRVTNSERAGVWRTLTALTTLCVQPVLFETLVIRLTTKLELILSAPASSKDGTKDGELEAAYAHSLLRTLARTLSVKVSNGHADVPKYLDRLVLRLLHLFVRRSVVSLDAAGPQPTDLRLLTAAGDITRLVVQTLPEQKQSAFITSLFAAYFDSDTRAIQVSGQQAIPQQPRFAPFEPGASTHQKNLVSLFASVVVPLNDKVTLPVSDLSALLRRLVDWIARDAQNEHQMTAVWHVLSSIVNKRPQDVADFLSYMSNTFWEKSVLDRARTPDERSRSIETWTWVCRALLVRNHPDAAHFSDRVFNIFDDTAINWDAARAVGAMIKTDDVLTKSNHTVFRILHVQRFVHRVLPRIKTGIDKSEGHEQTAYIVALTSLITSIPKSAYAQEMPTLLPLLLRALDLPDHAIRAGVMDTLHAFVEGDASDASDKVESTDATIISEHATTLVKVMLKNCMAREMPAANVRIAALRLLGALPHVVRYDVLHPVKANVIRQLSGALDDPKRSVRREAVDARYTYTG